MQEIMVIPLMLAGAFFMMLAGVGVLRMPDVFLRMSATSKAGTLGIGLMLIGAAIFFNEFSITTRAIATILFMLLTAPIAAHMIGRAAYFDRVPLWKGTIRDDLRDHYHQSNHSLDSQSAGEDALTPVPNEGDDFDQAQ